MGYVCLLGTAWLLKPWTKIEHHHPRFCSSVIFMRYFIHLRNHHISLQRYDIIVKINVVQSNVETENTSSNRLSRVQQMSVPLHFPQNLGYPMVSFEFADTLRHHRAQSENPRPSHLAAVSTTDN